jgi:FAD/FMN-containing dehydrogenase
LVGSFQGAGGPAPEAPLPQQETVLDKGITLWGATATGKTSFLAALYGALIDQKTGWRLRGEDEASADQLVSFTDTLVDQHTFPLATEKVQEYHWSLVGRVPSTEWRWYGPRRRREDVVVPLNVVDAAGEVLSASKSTRRTVTKQFVTSLANSTGIVFCFDPIREHKYGDAFEHTFGVLAQLDTRLKPKGRLPHFVAVCITKFDEPRMLDAAQRMGVIDYDIDAPYFPRVMEGEAREFFSRVCAVSKTRTAHRVLPILEETFDPDKIRYFVTSSIGFYVDPLTGMFNPRDYQQHIPGPTDRHPGRIRGDVRPINVVEPIIWLGNQLTRPVS